MSATFKTAKTPVATPEFRNAAFSVPYGLLSPCEDTITFECATVVEVFGTVTMLFKDTPDGVGRLLMNDGARVYDMFIPCYSEDGPAIEAHILLLVDQAHARFEEHQAELQARDDFDWT